MSLEQGQIDAARGAFQSSGGKPEMAGAALDIATLPGIQVHSVEVGGQVNPELPNITIRDQISGQDRVIKGGVPTASIKVVANIPTDPAIRGERHREIARQLGRDFTKPSE